MWQSTILFSVGRDSGEIAEGQTRNWAGSFARPAQWERNGPPRTIIKKAPTEPGKSIAATWGIQRRHRQWRSVAQEPFAAA